MVEKLTNAIKKKFHGAGSLPSERKHDFTAMMDATFKDKFKTELKVIINGLPGTYRGRLMMS